jgi:hypothetical protein
MIKALMKLVIERIYLNKIKAKYDKSIDNFIISEEKLKPFLLKSRKDKGVHSLHLYYILWFLILFCFAKFSRWVFALNTMSTLLLLWDVHLNYLCLSTHRLTCTAWFTMCFSFHKDSGS